MSEASEGSTERSAPVDQRDNPFPPIELPVFEKPSEAELERRRNLFDEALRIRAAIRAKYGPLDISTSELKHLARSEQRF